MSLQVVIGVILGLVAGVAVEYADIERLKAQLVTAHDELAAVKAAAQNQATIAHETDAQNEARAHDIQVQLTSALAAHAATSDALADRVRQYSALERSCTVRQTTQPTAGRPRPLVLQAPTGGPRPVDDALAAIAGDAQAVIDQGMACAKWAGGTQP